MVTVKEVGEPGLVLNEDLETVHQDWFDTTFVTDKIALPPFVTVSMLLTKGVPVTRDPLMLVGDNVSVGACVVTWRVKVLD